MSALRLGSIRRLSRLAVKAAIQTEDDATPSIADAGRDLLLASTSGAFPPTLVAKEHAAHIIAGAIEGANQAGGDALIVIRSIVQGTIQGAWETGADIGSVAVQSVGAAAQVAGSIGIDSDAAIKSATEGAFESGRRIGAEATRWIADALRDAFRRDSSVIGDWSQSDSSHG